MKNCENCNCEHDESYGSGRFCSNKCARGFSTKAKRKEINKKVSKTLKEKESGHGKVKKICPECKSKFEVFYQKRHQLCCSISCGSKYRWNDEIFAKMMSNIFSKIAIQRHKNKEENFGWSTRKKFQMSYPETIAKRKLDELNVSYINEYNIGKYFIDFALLENKIAIEIDGQQHKLIERKEKDKEKDKYLKSRGWIIYRIQWPGENIRTKIEKIMAYTGAL